MNLDSSVMSSVNWDKLLSEPAFLVSQLEISGYADKQYSRIFGMQLVLVVAVPAWHLLFTKVFLWSLDTGLFPPQALKLLKGRNQ